MLTLRGMVGAAQAGKELSLMIFSASLIRSPLEGGNREQCQPWGEGGGTTRQWTQGFRTQAGRREAELAWPWRMKDGVAGPSY